MSNGLLQGFPEGIYYVYTLLCQDREEDGPGYLKIGMSMDVVTRITSIMVACPVPAHYTGLIKVGTEKRAREVERALLEKFAKRRITGEWFRFDFSCEADKREFNDGCKEVFAWHLAGRKEKWWTKVSIEAYKEDIKRRAVESRQRTEKEREKAFWDRAHAPKTKDEPENRRRIYRRH